MRSPKPGSGSASGAKRDRKQVQDDGSAGTAREVHAVRSCQNVRSGRGHSLEPPRRPTQYANHVHHTRDVSRETPNDHDTQFTAKPRGRPPQRDEDVHQHLHHSHPMSCENQVGGVLVRSRPTLRGEVAVKRDGAAHRGTATSPQPIPSGLTTLGTPSTGAGPTSPTTTGRMIPSAGEPSPELG